MSKSKAKKATSKAKSSAKSKAAKPVAANATSFEIVKNHTQAPRKRGGGGVSIYPFASMEEGDTFFIDSTVDADLYTNETEAGKARDEELRKVSNRMSGAVRRFTKKNADRKFSVRTELNPATQAWAVSVQRVKAA